MLQTIEAMIDQNGTLRVLEPVQWPKHRRVLITILNEEPACSDDQAWLNRGNQGDKLQ